MTAYQMFGFFLDILQTLSNLFSSPIVAYPLYIRIIVLMQLKSSQRLQSLQYKIIVSYKIIQLQMQRQNLTGIKIPEQIRAAGAFLGAVFVDFADTECVTAYNSRNLYFLEVVQNNVVKYSSYNVPNIQNLISIIKGYLLITTKEEKLWLFQLRKVQKKQEPPKNFQGRTSTSAEKAETKVQKLLTVESFLKQISFSSYFLREVTPNMIELFVTAYNNDKSQKMLYIYQFTVKQKVGGMGFTIDKNYKIVAHSRKQLYASKSFFDSRIKTLIKLKNFSDNIFTAKKITEQYAFMIPIGKTQEYCYLTKNYELVNAQNPSQRNKVKEELKGYQIKNGIQHLNYLLLRNQQGYYGLFVVEELLKIRQIAEENNQYIWNVCFNGKLVGVHRNGQDIVVTEEYNKKADKLSITKPDQIMVIDNLSKQQKHNSEIIKSSSKLDANPKTQQNVEMSEEKRKPETKQIEKKIQVTVEQQGGKDITQQSKQSMTPNKVKDEPQASKHKSTFKPAKIVSRKDLKKQNKNVETADSKNADIADSKNDDNKGVDKQEQMVKQTEKQANVQSENMATKNKKQQQINLKVQQQKVAIKGDQNKQKEEKKQQQLKSEQQNNKSKDMPDKQQVKNIKQQPNSGTKKQNPFLKHTTIIAAQPDRLKQNNPFNLSNVQSGQKNINFAAKDEKPKKDLSPFAKKNVFPTLSYEEIFGARASSGFGAGLSLFGSTGKNKQSVQKSPFKKKQEPEVVVQKQKIQIASKVPTNSQNKPNQGKVDAFQSTAEKNVENVQGQTKKEQKTKLKQTLPQQQQQAQNKQGQQQREGAVQRQEKGKKAQVIGDMQIKDAEPFCCVNYDTIKSSYDLFSDKITSLQTQARQNQQNYSNMAQQISRTVQIAFKNAQTQLLNVSQQKAIKNGGVLLENSVNDYLSKKLTPKVNDYFKSILAETKKIYDHTLKFYVDKKKQTVTNLQNHFQEQEHLVSQIRQISADTMAAVQNTVNEGQQAHAYLLKEWNKCTQRLCQRLDSNLDALQAHTHDRSASQRQKIIDSVVQLRQTLGAQQQRQRNARQQAKIMDQTKKRKEIKRKVKQEDEQQEQSQKNKRRKAKKQKQKQKQLKIYKEQLLRRQMMMRMQPYSMAYHY